jgi:hypothetical protein
MGKKGGSAPKAPDPDETAMADARYNRMDTYGPSGSGVRHGYTDNGRFVQGAPREGYQSAMQYLENPYEAAVRRSLEPASVALTDRVIADNIYGMPDAARARDRSDVAGDMFNRSFSLMSPAIDKSNERLLTNLQRRGLPVGSEAFNEAYQQQLETTQDTLSRLAMESNLAAGQEQSRQFRLDQDVRSGAISELVAAMGGGYSPPGATPSGSAPGVNYADLANQQYQSQLSQYNAQQQQQASTAQSIGSIAAAGLRLMKCTADAKIVHGEISPENVARAMERLPLFAWTYKPDQAPPHDHGGMHIGPMAEHFRAAFGLGTGKEIDVIDAVGVLMGALQGALARIAQLEAIMFEDDDDGAAVPDEDQTARLH